MMAGSDNASLTDYLKRFDLPIWLMQTKDNLKRIAFELACDLKKDDVIYAEVRFSPLFHTREGLTKEEVVESVLDGFRECDGIKINLLLCMMRGLSFEDNLEIINLAKLYLGKGVCGIDLAGDEYNYKTYLYKELFKIAKDKNILFTIHAGEADGVDSIKNAIECGASRIGHGIRCIEDKDIMNMIKDKNILLEICPTSNIDTKVVDSYNNHPIRYLYDKGIKLSINTDNNTVSNITLDDEYNNLKKYLSFTDKELLECNKNALRASFITEREKEELIKMIEQ